jgi:hypothetical protein
MDPHWAQYSSRTIESVNGAIVTAAGSQYTAATAIDCGLHATAATMKWASSYSHADRHLLRNGYFR